MGNWCRIGLSKMSEKCCRGVSLVNRCLVCVMYLEDGGSILWKGFGEVIIVGVHWGCCGVGRDVVKFDNTLLGIAP